MRQKQESSCRSIHRIISYPARSVLERRSIPASRLARINHRPRKYLNLFVQFSGCGRADLRTQLLRYATAARLPFYYVERITIVISDERATITSRKRCDSRDYIFARFLRSA